MADETFAAKNWAYIHAVGGVMPLTRVRYAKNGVPDRMMGSFPMTAPERKKNE